MAFRSCICSKTTSHLFKAFYKNSKYPGIQCFHHLSSTKTASISSLTNQLEKIELTPSAQKKSPESYKLDSAIHDRLTFAQKKSLYLRLASLSPADLAKLFSNKLKHVDYEKKLRQIFLDASAYWPVTTTHGVLSEWGPKHMQLRLDLFTNNLLPKYTLNRDIESIIQALPTNGKHTDLMPFYNAALSYCQRRKEYKHIRLLLDVMKERNIQLDVASHNILLRITLSEDKNISGFDAYHRLVLEGVEPNPATYNILINHAVQQKQWHTLKQWLDLMEADSLEPTQVTARILFRALTKYPLEDDLSEAFDRISHAIPLVEKEKFINTSASTLIKSNQSEDAIEVINQALESNEPLSVYTYNLLLKALCNTGKIGDAQRILDSMMSAKQIPKADIVSFTTVIHGLVRQPDKTNFKEISRLYDQLSQHGLHTNNVLQSVILYGLLKSDDVDKATTLFRSMLKNKNKLYIPQQHGDQPLSEINVYNMMIDFYFLHYHKSKKLTHTMPQQPFNLLNEAIVQKKLKPTVSTMNIMVRGLAILNKDLNAAEKVVKLLKTKGVHLDERTVWYLTKAAYRQNHLTRAREWIQHYESLGHEIQGSGLKSLKAVLNNWEKDTTYTR